ncbi:hypothetical protein ATL31_0762 [Phycicoccus duodecadis]|uniref:Uncharacterized protein n=1 Tax=Phycicoccus duodecadis TaxID=173053 RepID=A0A2N3YGI7_9MICO|nr:hypothetical protein ATL31_0762 [Phycicoccus duodecadis]
MRVARGVRVLAAVLMVPLGAGILVAVVDALRAGDPGVSFDRTGWSAFVVLGWVVALLVLAGVGLSLWALWGTSVRLTPFGVARQTFGRRHETGLADLRRVQARGASTHGPTGPRPAAVLLLDRDGRVAAALRPTETGFDEGLAVVRGWVARRPDLLQDTDTAAVLGTVDPARPPA